MERLSFSPWRELLLEEIGKYYSGKESTHSLDHARQVEKLVFETAQEPEYSCFDLDLEVLTAAALLHDTGYSQKRPEWFDDQREHVREGMRIAQGILRIIPSFSEAPLRIEKVLYLILNHDNTNYLFPIKGREGRPAITKEWTSQAEKGEETEVAMLTILKEADGLLATGCQGAKRTLEFNLSQGVPLFARGDPLRAWMWGESAVGSVRLAAKRALLDARTEKGKKLAWQGYLEAEELIKKECYRQGVAYQPELGLKELQALDKGKDWGEIEIIRVYPWEELEGILRQTRLQGDSHLFPYAAAKIASEALGVDKVYPLSYYALSNQLELHQKLRQLFLTSYALDLLDLSGIIEFETREGKYLISPPLVEISKQDGGRPLLVDGINRFLLAQRLGIPKVRSIVVSDIPDHFPLVPLPLSWEEVKILQSVPSETAKRRFRFPSLTSFPDIRWFSGVEVTEQACRYFFYRDLSLLGSSGIRKPGKES